MRFFILCAVLLLLGAAEASTRVLDDFEDIAGWKSTPSDGVSLTLSQAEGTSGRALRLDFDFHGGAGYAVARQELPFELPENYEISFQVRAEAPINNFEVKLIDPTNQNVWWVNRQRFEFPREWTRIRLKKRHIQFAWGPAGGGEIRKVAALEFAITAGTGGKGTVLLDELTLRELPPAHPYDRTPTVTSGPGWTAWDFLEDLEYGGLVIDWEQGAAAARYAVEISDDGKTWKTLRQVEGGNGGRDYLYTPEIESRHLRLRLLDGPGKIKNLDVKPLDWAPTINAFFEMIAKDAPRGSYPRAFSGEQAYWTVVGLDGDNEEGLLGEDGALEVGQGAFSIEPVLFLDGELITWSGVETAQSLAEGYLPIPTVTWTRGNLSLEVTAFASGSGLSARYRVRNQGAAAKRLRLFLALRPFQVNPPTQFLNQPGGVSSIREIAWDGHRAVINGERIVIPESRPDAFGVTTFDGGEIVEHLRQGKLPAVSSITDPFGYASGALAWDFDVPQGGERSVDITVSFGTGKAPEGPRHVARGQSDEGAATPGGETDDIPKPQRGGGTFGRARVCCRPSGAWGKNWYLLTRGRRSFVALTPGYTPEPLRGSFIQQPGEPGQSAMPWNGFLPSPGGRGGDGRGTGGEGPAAYWHKRLDRVEIDLPPAAVPLVHTFKTSIAHILINRDGPAIQPGSRAYARTWIRDGSLTSSALLRAGHSEEARDLILWYAPYQFANGKVPCCVDARGADPVPENDSHGELIFLIAEYWRFTRDRATVEKVWPHVEKAVAYIDELRSQRRTGEYRQADKRKYFGLLPESISHEGYSARPVHSYWDDFFALKGLKDAVDLAQVLGKKNEATRWAAIRDEFRADLYASLDRVISEARIEYIPGSAELADFDATSTTTAISPGGELEHLPRPALEQTFERYWREFVRRRTATDWEGYTPYELRVVGTFVRLGWKDRAHELLEFFMKDRRPPGWNQWPEVVRRDPRAPGFQGDLPHTWVASDFMRSFLDLFAYERDSDQALVLGAGVPAEWLARPEGIAVRNLATPWGPLSFTLTRHGKGVRYSIASGTEIPPGGIVLTWPLEGQPAGGPVVVRRLPATVDLDGAAPHPRPLSHRPPFPRERGERLSTHPVPSLSVFFPPLPVGGGAMGEGGQGGEGSAGGGAP